MERTEKKGKKKITETSNVFHMQRPVCYKLIALFILVSA